MNILSNLSIFSLLSYHINIFIITNAPDTITPEIYAKIRGHSKEWARSRFKEKNFPRLESGKLVADKTAVRLYDMGIDVKNNPKQSVELLILLELQKMNERSERQ